MLVRCRFVSPRLALSSPPRGFHDHVMMKKGWLVATLRGQSLPFLEEYLHLAILLFTLYRRRSVSTQIIGGARFGNARVQEMEPTRAASPRICALLVQWSGVGGGGGPRQPSVRPPGPHKNERKACTMKERRRRAILGSTDGPNRQALGGILTTSQTAQRRICRR